MRKKALDDAGRAEEIRRHAREEHELAKAATKKANDDRLEALAAADKAAHDH